MCQSSYPQISSRDADQWIEKGAKYTSLDFRVDVPQGLPDGYSSFNISLNGIEGINIIRNFGVEIGAGLVMNSFYTESTIESHSKYSNSLEEWFSWTTGEEATSSTSFAFQIMPGIRYTTNNVILRGSMVFAKSFASANTYSTCGNISIGYIILKKQSFVLHPSVGYIFGVGKNKGYGSFQIKIGIEGLSIL